MKNDFIYICPHCGNKTVHEKIFHYEFVPTAYHADGKKDDHPGVDIAYEIWKCRTCNDISLVSTILGDPEGYRLDYPKGAELDASVPETVADNYKEAKMVQINAPNAFAVLIRRALEAICDDRKVKKGGLKTRLDELASRGEIPDKLVKITTVLRELGNAGAHNTGQNVTVPLAWEMDEFFRVIIEYVYVAPAKLAEFEKRLKENKAQQSDSGDGA